MRPMADVAVVLPGITGSVLRDSAGRDVWAPTAGATARALVSLGRSLADFELRDENADDGVTAPMMIPDLHLIPRLWEIDGYSKLSAVGRINHSGLQVNVGATAVNSITLGEDLLLGAVHHGSARGGRALPAARRKNVDIPVGVHQFLAIMVASIRSALLRGYVIVLLALFGVLLLVGSLI